MKANERKINKLFNEKKGVIKRLILIHKKIGAELKRKGIDFVLTHGDITGLNIIKTEQGLKLLDWENVMFAPPERDLNFFHDHKNFPELLPYYLKPMNKKDVEKDLIEYYSQQWALRSIVNNFKRLFSKEKRFIDKQEAIKEIIEYTGYFEWIN